jgi:hemolysin activation/secretion protein
MSNQVQGQCLGGKGINLLMSSMHNKLGDHGYITGSSGALSRSLLNRNRVL